MKDRIGKSRIKTRENSYFSIKLLPLQYQVRINPEGAFLLFVQYIGTL